MTSDIQSSSIMDTRKNCINVIYPVLFIEICSLKKPILMGHPVWHKLVVIEFYATSKLYSPLKLFSTGSVLKRPYSPRFV